MNRSQREFVRALIGVSGLLAAHHVRRIAPQHRLEQGVAIALVGFAVSEAIHSHGGGGVFLQALLDGMGA